MFHAKEAPLVILTRYDPYILSGILHCAQCGDVLCGKSAHGNGGKIAYYEHAWATKRQSCLNKKVFACEPNRILARKLETAVWDQIERLLTDPELAKELTLEAQKHHQGQGQVVELDKIRNKIRGIEEQIEALAEHLTKIPKGMNPGPIFSQMQKLEATKEAARRELDEMARQGVCADLPAGLKDYQDFLGALQAILAFGDSSVVRTRLIRWLVAKIEVLPNSFRLHYYIGKSHVIPMKWEQVEKLRSAIREQTLAPQKAHVGPDANSAPGLNSVFKDFGSNTLTNGAGHGARTRDLLLGKETL